MIFDNLIDVLNDAINEIDNLITETKQFLKDIINIIEIEKNQCFGDKLWVLLKIILQN